MWTGNYPCGRETNLLPGPPPPLLGIPHRLQSPTNCYGAPSIETEQMSSAETGQMSAVETGKMSAAGTGQMSAAETRQMSTIATGLCTV